MYALIENDAVKQYPYSLGELKIANPNTSFPTTMSTQAFESYGVFRVYSTTVPAYNEKTQTVEAGTPVFDVDARRWAQTWTVRDLNAEEVQSKNDAQASAVRSDRNNKLAETDWTQVADAPVNKIVWATYRQALRDVTTQTEFPWSVNWPTQPE